MKLAYAADSKIRRYLVSWGFDSPSANVSGFAPTVTVVVSREADL